MTRAVSLLSLGPAARAQASAQIMAQPVRSERELHKLVVQHLTAVLPEDVVWFHYRANDMTRRGGGIWKGLGVKSDIPDFCVMWRKVGLDEFQPAVLWLELKSAFGRLRPGQKTMATQLMAMGHHWYVCRSIADIDAALEMCNVPRNR